jgi:hypothetical protein
MRDALYGGSSAHARVTEFLIGMRRDQSRVATNLRLTPAPTYTWPLYLTPDT